MAENIKIGDILEVKVIGSQPYGLFVRPIEHEDYTGLIHISEISYGFVKDVNQIADSDQTIKAKVIDIVSGQKHLKLSIKAMFPKRDSTEKWNRKINIDKNDLSDFTPLAENLEKWINDELKKGDKNYD